MKYSHLFSISISTGILFCVWAIAERSTTIGRAADDVASPTASPSPSSTTGPVQDAGPFTDYVKHNPGAVATPSPSVATASPKPQATPSHPKVDPWFFAQLVSEDNGKTGYIRYSITDEHGVPTEWHSSHTNNNEDPSSSLFQTKFDFTKPMTVSKSGGEVTITGTGTTPTDPNPKSYTWTSDTTKVTTDDGDVSWTP